MHADDTKYTFSKREILGEIAHWAVCQSPYHRPDNLEVVLDKMNTLIKDVDEYPVLSPIQMRVILDRLKQIPEFIAWNDRKNGNQSPYKFTSRYDKKGNPDDDFIDLDALIHNVLGCLVNDAVPPEPTVNS